MHIPKYLLLTATAALLLAATACTHPAAAPVSTSPLPTLTPLDTPLPDFTLDTLDLTSPTVTRTLTLTNHTLATALANFPFTAHLNTTLTVNPSTGGLTLTGPLLPVTALIERLISLDTESLASQTIPLHHADPTTTTAATINNLFLLCTNPERVQTDGILALPTADSIVLITFPNLARLASNLTLALDVDPALSPNHDAKAKHPLDVQNITLSELFDDLSKTYDMTFLFDDSRLVTQRLTIKDTVPVTQSEIATILRAVLRPLGYVTETLPTADKNPRLIIHVFAVFGGKPRTPTHIGNDPSKILTPNPEKFQTQIIPLTYLAPTDAMSAVTSLLSPYPDIEIRHASHAIAITAETEKVRRATKRLHDLDRPLH